MDEEQNLADEAVRLAQVLAGVLPDDDEVRGLLALLLFQHARRAARLDADGELVPLPEQDRTRWDAEMIARGRIELAAARDSGPTAGLVPHPGRDRGSPTSGRRPRRAPIGMPWLPATTCCWS